MRVGLLFGGIDLTIREMILVARQAEAIGMHGLYCVEAYRSGLLPLAALAQATSRVSIGPYVLNAYCRTPFAAGLAALDLDEMSRGRLVMAVGSGNAHITQRWLGAALVPALEKMRDYTVILQRMMRARKGERVSYAGKVHSIEWSQQAHGPAGPPVPIYLAAIFPKMLELAGAAADGLALGAMTGPDYVREIIRPSVAAAAARAGRDPAALRYKMCAMVAVDDDRQSARRFARNAVAGTFATHPHPYYEYMLREQGFAVQLERSLLALAAGDFAGVADAIDDAVIDATVIWGTPDECVARLGRYEGLIDEMVLANVRPGSIPDAAEPCAAYRPVLDVAARFSTVNSNSE